jgi:hypothetical protein
MEGSASQRVIDSMMMNLIEILESWLASLSEIMIGEIVMNYICFILVFFPSLWPIVVRINWQMLSCSHEQ